VVLVSWSILLLQAVVAVVLLLAVVVVLVDTKLARILQLLTA